MRRFPIRTRTVPLFFNRKRRTLLLLWAVGVLVATGLTGAAEAQTERLPGPLLEGLGDRHHPVTPKSPQAQRYFDQGLR
jgi:hypothetical protein